MGLVVVRARRGVVVAEFAPQQLAEMFELMAELEAMCGRLAARRMFSNEHAELLKAHEACTEAHESGDSDDDYYRNEAFHDRIYAGSHNAFLAEQARNLTGVCGHISACSCGRGTA
jgi:DNA-binding GntR family transcriptional regulator